MAQDAYPVRGRAAGIVEQIVRIQGASTSDPTKMHGVGVTVTRTGSGAYRITWSENPGTFVGVTYALQATTVADLKGHTVVFGVYDATNFRLDFTLFNASDSADDLLTAEFINIMVSFKHGTGV